MVCGREEEAGTGCAAQDEHVRTSGAILVVDGIVELMGS